MLSLVLLISTYAYLILLIYFDRIPTKKDEGSHNKIEISAVSSKPYMTKIYQNKRRKKFNAQQKQTLLSLLDNITMYWLFLFFS